MKSEVGVTFRCSPELRDVLTLEGKEKGYPSLNKYIPVIVAARHNTSAPDPGNQDKYIREIEALKNQVLKLNKEKKELSDRIPKDSTTDQLEHVFKRAWEIARISKEQLMKGFNA